MNTRKTTLQDLISFIENDINHKSAELTEALRLSDEAMEAIAEKYILDKKWAKAVIEMLLEYEQV